MGVTKTRFFSQVLLLIAFAMYLLYLSTQVVSADFNRLEQLTKSSRTNFGLQIVSGAKQTLSCSDLSGQIEKLTVSTLKWDNTQNSVLQASFVGGLSPTKVSDTITLVPGPREQKDLTFTFNPPIDVDTDLCANGGTVEFQVKNLTNYIVYLFGSTDPSSYPNGVASLSAGSATYDLKDLYFIVNPHSNTNLAPEFGVLQDFIINEGQTLVFTTVATDTPNSLLTYAATGIPTGASYNSATGEFNWTPTYTQAGTYPVTFTVSDGELSDTEIIDIVVTNTNRAPVLSPIGNQVVNENSLLSFTVSAIDADGDAIVLSANNLPSGATFSNGTFTWTPTFTQAGNYENIEFVATDNGTPLELAVELITITVGDINRAPELSNPGPQSVLEGQTVTFTITASDPDTDAVTLAASGVPSGAVFNVATGLFSWIPTNAQSGVYTVTVTATDNGLPVESGSVDIVITVGDDPTPVEQSQIIINTIVSFNLPNNVTNSYMANLQKVEPFITGGQIQPAINQLNAFINKVNNDYNQGKLTLTQRNQLVALAQQLLSDLQ